MRTIKKRLAKVLGLTTLLAAASMSTSNAGVIYRLYYDGITTGTAVTNLTTDPIYPLGVTFVQPMTNGLTSARDQGDNYGTWIRGYVEAPQTGNYVFYIGSDDSSELSINPAGIDPAGAQKVAEETGCCAPLFSGDRLVDRSSDAIPLTRGQKYYISVLQKEGIGGDYIDVGWQLPDGTQQAVPLYHVYPFPVQANEVGGNAGGPAVAKAPAFIATSGTGQPQSQTVSEGRPVTFYVDVDGSQPMTLQWKTNGVNVPDAILGAYTLSQATLGHNGMTVSVSISNAQGNLNSDPATLTVLADSELPTIVSAGTRGNPNGVTVTFSEPIDGVTGAVAGNYTVNNGVTVTSATVAANGLSVQLATSTIASGNVYTLTVNGVRDRAATPNTITGATTTFLQTHGVITRNMFLNIGGAVTIPDLTNNVKFPNSPDLVTYETQAEIVPGFADNYGAQLVGYVTAPVSGQYVFYMSSDDNGRLFLSTDDSPQNKVLIAQEPNWSDSRNWITSNNADSGRGDPPSNISAPITLTAGHRYYIEALVKEGGGGDNLGVAWQIPGGEAPVNGSAPIAGQYLSAYKNSGPISITNQPVSLLVGELQVATFSVGVDGTPAYTYQWYRNDQPIIGANGSTYTIASTAISDDGSVFKVAVSNAFSGVVSGTATLSVDQDNTAPTVTSISSDSSFTLVNVVFSEAVTPATAQTLGNYTIAGLTVSNPTLQADGRTVVLTTSTQAPGVTYNVTVRNIRDTSANNNTLTEFNGSFTAWVEAIGGLTRLMFRDTGTAGGDVLNYAAPGTFREYITAAPFSAVMAPFGSDVKTNSTIVTIFESPRDNVGVNIDNYYVVMYGHIIPPVNGDYTFVVSADDAAKLFLSTSALPENAVEIAREPTWNGYRDWNGTTRRPAGENRSAPITLTAGTKYYVEAVYQEGGGGDGMEVAWILPGDTDGIANNEPSISGDFLMTIQPANPAPVQISQVPTAGRLGESRTTTITLELRDGNTGNDPVDTSSVVMKVDGATVTPTATRNGTVTTITYTPTTELPAFKVINVEVSLRYGTPATKNYTNSWSFQTDLDRVATFVPGTIFIEAEDYNHSGGQYIADANGGVNGAPYNVGAYLNLAGVTGIDFLDNTTGGAGDVPAYRYDPPNDAQNRPSTTGFGNTNRGSFGVTSNWKVGWTGNGEWMNYTRVFPATPQTFDVYASIPSGGSNPNPILHRVTSPATATGQTVEELGQFSGQASGDWGRAVFYKLHEVGNAAVSKQVTLGGVNTIRMSIGSGAMDLDFLAFVPSNIVEPVDPPVITVTRSGSDITISWINGGTLQGAATVNGPWTAVGGASPVTVPAGTGMQFFRVVRGD